MKPIKSLLVLAVLLVPAIAGAQGYYGGGGGYGAPLPGGFHNRMGRPMWGVSVGLGGMSDDGGDIKCDASCDYNPISVEVDAHLGGMLSPRFGLMAEFQDNAQTVHSDVLNGDTVLTQSALMIAGQFWITPQFWVKGGIGLAHLDTQDAFGPSGNYGGGGVIMGAAGFELLSARFFAVDLQGRLIEGTYHGINDHVTGATIGLGLNWY
ncbi:MAG: hypothetical protein JO257_29740 [Deltaproteobacteria bacterium]|nr:hypothetical protein [Deltaproteobacteria bacterium]